MRKIGLLVAAALGLQTPAAFALTEITSLPYTCNSPGEAYEVNGDLASTGGDGSGITVTETCSIQFNNNAGLRYEGTSNGRSLLDIQAACTVNDAIFGVEVVVTVETSAAVALNDCRWLGATGFEAAIAVDAASCDVSVTRGRITHFGTRGAIRLSENCTSGSLDVYDSWITTTLGHSIEDDVPNTSSTTVSIVRSLMHNRAPGRRIYESNQAGTINITSTTLDYNQAGYPVWAPNATGWTFTNNLWSVVDNHANLGGVLYGPGTLPNPTTSIDGSPSYTNESIRDFRPLSDSEAIDLGSGSRTIDVLGNPGVVGAAVDSDPHEFQAVGTTGACCFPDESCSVDTEANCTGSGGSYQGDATDCDPDPCSLSGCPPSGWTEVTSLASPLVLVSDGRYAICGDITAGAIQDAITGASGVTNVIIQGFGDPRPILDFTSVTRSGIRLEAQCEQIHFEHIAFTGTNLGVHALGGDDITVTDCEFDAATLYYEPKSIAGGSDDAIMDRPEVTNCEFRNMQTGWQGPVSIGAGGASVRDLTFTGNYLYHDDGEQDGVTFKGFAFIGNCRVNNNTFILTADLPYNNDGSSKGNEPFKCEACPGTEGSRNEFIGNSVWQWSSTIAGEAGGMISIRTGSSYWTVEENYVVSVASRALLIGDNSSNAIIRNNTLIGLKNDLANRSDINEVLGVRTGADNSRVEGNLIISVVPAGETGEGHCADIDADNCLVYGNTLVSMGDGDGIEGDGLNMDIRGNTFYQGGTGVHVAVTNQGSFLDYNAYGPSLPTFERAYSAPGPSAITGVDVQSATSDSSTWNWRPATSDGAIDSGLDAIITWAKDLAGNPRIINMVDRSAYEFVPSSGQTGACCFEDGSCLILSSTDCTTQSGTYQGNFTVCVPNPCQQPEVGACCTGNGACSITEEADCTGLWYDNEDTCSPNPCPVSEFGTSYNVSVIAAVSHPRVFMTTADITEMRDYYTNRASTEWQVAQLYEELEAVADQYDGNTGQTIVEAPSQSHSLIAAYVLTGASKYETALDNAIDFLHGGSWTVDSEDPEVLYMVDLRWSSLTASEIEAIAQECLEVWYPDGNILYSPRSSGQHYLGWAEAHWLSTMCALFAGETGDAAKDRAFQAILDELRKRVYGLTPYTDTGMLEWLEFGAPFLKGPDRTAQQYGAAMSLAWTFGRNLSFWPDLDDRLGNKSSEAIAQWGLLRRNQTTSPGLLRGFQSTAHGFNEDWGAVFAFGLRLGPAAPRDVWEAYNGAVWDAATNEEDFWLAASLMKPDLVRADSLVFANWELTGAIGDDETVDQDWQEVVRGHWGDDEYDPQDIEQGYFYLEASTDQVDNRTHGRQLRILGGYYGATMPASGDADAGTTHLNWMLSAKAHNTFAHVNSVAPLDYAGWGPDARTETDVTTSDWADESSYDFADITHFATVVPNNRGRDLMYCKGNINPSAAYGQTFFDRLVASQTREVVTWSPQTSMVEGFVFIRDKGTASAGWFVQNWRSIHEPTPQNLASTTHVANKVTDHATGYVTVNRDTTVTSDATTWDGHARFHPVAGVGEVRKVGGYDYEWWSYLDKDDPTVGTNYIGSIDRDERFTNEEIGGWSFEFHPSSYTSPDILTVVDMQTGSPTWNTVAATTGMSSGDLGAQVDSITVIFADGPDDITFTITQSGIRTIAVGGLPDDEYELINSGGTRLATANANGGLLYFIRPNYQADDYTIRAVTAQSNLRACCLEDGTCVLATNQECVTTLGGIPIQEALECDPDPCPAFGACCDANGQIGTCTIEIETDCTGQAGTYQGDGTDCDPDPCTDVSGACCLSNDVCVVVTTGDCTTLSGTYQGDGTVCVPTPCSPTITEDLVPFRRPFFGIGGSGRSMMGGF